MLFTLMNGDDRVFDFVFDEDRNAVLEIRTIFDLCRAPIAIWNERVSRFATNDTLATLTDRWWKRRGIPSPHGSI